MCLFRESRTYYRNYIRQNFVAHSDETDGDRLALMLRKARDDAAWVLRKYAPKQ